MSDYFWEPNYPGHGPHVGQYTLYKKAEHTFISGRVIPYSKPVAWVIQKPTGWVYQFSLGNGRYSEQAEAPTKRIKELLPFVYTVARMG